jgi:peptidoglycan/LPS O-acetylase OafA/YrhL
MAAERAVDPGRVVALDLLRGLAALAVAVPHFFAYRNRAAPDTLASFSRAAGCARFRPMWWHCC